MTHALAGIGVTIAALTLVWPGSSIAQLSQAIPLSEVLARSRQSPQISLIVKLELKRAKLGRDTVTCLSHTHDRQWDNLRGSPIGPYECSFGARVLVLQGHAEYADAGGQKLRAGDPALKDKAARVTESNFRWRWKKQTGNFK